MDNQNNLNKTNLSNPMDQPQSNQNTQTGNQEPLNPVIETPSVSDKQPQINNPVQKETSQDMPSFTQVDSATPPPPPIPTVQEFSNKEEKEKKGSNAPNLDIPPVITQSEKPKKKFGGKTIATILGILVLVGGIGAGIFLVKQSQDIREKASSLCSGICSDSNNKPGYTCTYDESCETLSDGREQYCCVYSSCQPNGLFCSADGMCCSGYCELSDHTCQERENPKPTSTPTPPNFCETEFEGTCRSNEISNPYGGCLGNETCCVPEKTPQNHTDRCIPDHQNEECDYSTGEMCTYYMGDMGYDEKCSLAGVQDICDEGYLCMIGGGASYCVTGYSNCQYQDPTCVDDPTCKTIPSTSAQCLYIKVYDEDWNTIPAAELTHLAVGAIIKFAVKGTTINGSLDKARFTINGNPSGDIVNKKPGTEEFYVEYTIPEDLSNFTVKAELHHTTLGWF